VKIRQALAHEAAPGLAMLAAAALGFALANSPWADGYERLLHLPVEIRIGELVLGKPLVLWIDEGLMTLFFLLVGLEIRHELTAGSLQGKKALAPLLAAAGGMVVPAFVYLLFNASDAEALRGWAIPMATDIAFALAALALVGKGLPASLRTFLLALAVIDDLGAVLVIAAFYTPKLSLAALAWALGCTALLAAVAWRGIGRAGPYIALGLLLWLAVLQSGAHATLAGVIIGALLPRKGPSSLAVRAEQALSRWVSFGVLPAFAFANAGVPLQGGAIDHLLDSVPVGIALGLLLGKPIGVVAGALLAQRAFGASLPEGITLPLLWGVGILAGIGFTMSLFIQALAFEDDLARAGADKLAILLPSLISGAAGWWWLRRQARESR